jgi:uncharacterized SAM-binding protein YcdF (DUF218 family)
MFRFETFVETFSSPVGLITILFLSGILLGLIRHQSHIGNRLVWAGAGLYLVFLMTPLAEVSFGSLERPFPSMLHPDPSVRTIVVLGAFGEESPMLPVTHKLNAESILRMVEGIRLYRELPGARLIVSGGILSHQDRPIANLLADFAKAMGVPNRDVVVEGLSTTTHENLLEVKKIVGTEPFILVTSSDHLRRAAAVARKLEMRALPAPAAVWVDRYPAGVSWLRWAWMVKKEMSTERLSYLQRAHREYLGYLWYWILGRV